MEEDQFQRLLGMFPIVRSRSYCADDAVGTSRRVPSGFSLASSNVELQQVDTESNREQTDTDKSTPQMSLASLHSKGNFWDQLKAAAEQQLLPEAAQKFCDAFRARHNEMVNNTLSLDGIERIAKHWPPTN
ncbi:uncharacterized protein [Physcomitrium patens]|uniref:Uncharacterized protein n=1 Tax=Physcomitrium patens TaxID=3218 RepID=A0A2K1IFK2_PHYPA|nr:uncharacterized protein LOC112276922 [Physcomitrium patens]XP_024364508.1 uncharacterized protein LOC112276922 [Physcomitrium patens]XP_024364510.1 uncharacterized protein LOC112276922 [Physcomitrium patens]XP_024364511.1 uncharacterized protein LOC112276922 [Physcomitrium patens]PNR28055.1 hypothetical protein PHYPA_028647 [Physcomitrium patens]|eukprot:XP_024364507.1 uncharacterized protein LOC112276922 [Physcomitrella patens]